MRHIVPLLLALAFSIAAMSATTLPAVAYFGTAPWCAVMSAGDDGKWDCRYSTLEECVPNVLAGNRGTCNPNPWFEPSAASSRRGRAGNSVR